MPTAIAHNVAILNRCDALTDREANAIAAALQEQVTKDFRSVWGIDAKINFVPKNKFTGWEGKWNLLLLDNSDVANALGYHDITPDGLPLGKVFAGTDKQYGALVSVTASHELLEMLLDPYINLVAEDTKRSYFVAYEACDAVEADDLAYLQGDLPVSDFVTPKFFDNTAAASEKFSFRGNVTAPFMLAPGGYEGVYVPGKGWKQIVARTNGPDPADRTRVGSRRERRFVASSHGADRVWRRSVL